MKLLHRTFAAVCSATLAASMLVVPAAAAPSTAAGPAGSGQQTDQSTEPTPAVRASSYPIATPAEVAAARQYVPTVRADTDPAALQRSVDAQLESAAADGVVVDIDFQYQQTGYWCGPAATRIALSARGVSVSQQQMANELPTSTNGTDWIGQVTRVLGNYVGWYETKEMPNDPPTQAQMDLLWRDIVLDLDNGFPIVANIVAPAGNHPPGYPNYTIYHYFTVIGYNPANHDVLIADPAGFAPTATYWLTFEHLASLIPPKGYSA